MLGLKVIHVSERGHWYTPMSGIMPVRDSFSQYIQGSSKIRRMGKIGSLGDMSFMRILSSTVGHLLSSSGKLSLQDISMTKGLSCVFCVVNIGPVAMRYVPYNFRAPCCGRNVKRPPQYTYMSEGLSPGFMIIKTGALVSEILHKQCFVPLRATYGLISFLLGWTDQGNAHIWLKRCYNFGIYK